MIVEFKYKGKKLRADLRRPLDISIPLVDQPRQVNCFFAPPFETFPVVAGGFVGSTRQGGALNFLNIRLNPHGNGTHTECYGHISSEQHTINKTFSRFHFLSKLVSVYPEKTGNGDRVIFPDHLREAFEGEEVEAAVIRTLPNDDSKCTRQYSGTNPPYLHHEAATFLADQGIQHLLIDLPSVDREEDGGKLASHKAFWKFPDNARKNCTISELIYVPNEIKDGLYLLNIQTASFEIDVSPSKPILYAIMD